MIASWIGAVRRACYNPLGAPGAHPVAGPASAAAVLYRCRHPAPDVGEWRRPADEPASLQPLARVFDAYWSNGQRFRNHGLGPVDGGTRSDLLSAALSERLRQFGPEDRALLVFNGHGAWNRQDHLGNRIMLWDSTSLDVRQLRTIGD